MAPPTIIFSQSDLGHLSGGLFEKEGLSVPLTLYSEVEVNTYLSNTQVLERFFRSAEDGIKLEVSVELFNVDCHLSLGDCSSSPNYKSSGHEKGQLQSTGYRCRLRWFPTYFESPCH